MTNTHKPAGVNMEPLAPQKEVFRCQVCGHEIEDRGPRGQRIYHDACKKWRNYLDAAVRAAREIYPKPTPAGASLIRQETFRAANQMAAIAQPRDSKGRFC